MPLELAKHLSSSQRPKHSRHHAFDESERDCAKFFFTFFLQVWLESAVARLNEDEATYSGRPLTFDACEPEKVCTLGVARVPHEYDLLLEFLPVWTVTQIGRASCRERV